MGKSIQAFIIQVAVFKSSLHSMMDWSNTNLSVKLRKDHNETFLLHQLQYDESTADAFEMGSFFNK